MLRLANPEDARRIAEIKIAAWNFAYCDILPAHILDIDLDEEQVRWTTRLQNTSNCIVSCSDQEIEGYATHGPSEVLKVPNEQQLYSLYVDPKAHRKGHGQRLVREVAEAVRASGHTKLIVCLFKQNAAARRFYEAMGAEFLCDASYRVDGIDYPDEVRIWRDLDRLIATR